jgi:hypothetical protein
LLTCESSNGFSLKRREMIRGEERRGERRDIGDRGEKRYRREKRR